MLLSDVLFEFGLGGERLLAGGAGRRRLFLRTLVLHAQVSEQLDFLEVPRVAQVAEEGPVTLVDDTIVTRMLPPAVEGHRRVAAVAGGPSGSISYVNW